MIGPITRAVADYLSALRTAFTQEFEHDYDRLCDAGEALAEREAEQEVDDPLLNYKCDDPGCECHQPYLSPAAGDAANPSPSGSAGTGHPTTAAGDTQAFAISGRHLEQLAEADVRRIVREEVAALVDEGTSHGYRDYMIRNIFRPTN